MRESLRDPLRLEHILDAIDRLSMMNKKKTLFIFEGSKLEGKLIGKLERNILGDRHAIKMRV